MNRKVYCMLLIILFLFSGCVYRHGNVKNKPVVSKKTERINESEEILNKPPKIQHKKNEKQIVAQINTPKVKEYEYIAPNGIIKKGKKHKITLSFDNVDIYELISNVLGEVLHKNFIIDSRIRNKISLYIDGTYTEDEILNLLAKALDIMDLSMIVDKDVVKILPKQNMGKNLYLNSNAIYGVEIIKLKNTYCYNIINNIRPFLTSRAIAISVIPNNSIIIVDKKENIKLIRKIIKIIDSEVFKGVKFVIFKPKYFNPSEMYDIVKNVINSSTLFAKSGIRRDIFVYPIQSNGSLLLISRNEDFLNLVLEWLKELDSPENVNETKIYVYKVENGEATDVANILNQIFGAGRTSYQSKGKVIVRGTTLKDTSLKGPVTIIPDKTNNTIIIKATPEDYAKIFKILKEIDTVPREVLINVLIAEISYEKGYNYGIEWYLRTKGINMGGNTYKGNAILNNGNAMNKNITLGSGILGFSYGIFDSENVLRGLFTAIEDHSKINILSAPSILAIDNHEAKIEVGQDVPIITQSVTNVNSNGNITNTVQYRNTGIILTVKPKINSGGLVRLDIVQEVSEAKSNQISGIDSPIFLKRRAETTLVVKNGQTIIIGGLLENKNDETASGIPGFRSLPGIGWMFGGKEKRYTKTELLIAITPRVVRNVSEAQAMNQEFLEKVKEIKELLSKQTNNAFKIKEQK